MLRGLTMTTVKASVGFALTCQCSRCRADSASLDALKAAGAKVERELKLAGASGFTLRCPDLPCSRCGNESYTVRFSSG